MKKPILILLALFLLFGCDSKTEENNSLSDSKIDQTIDTNDIDNNKEENDINSSISEENIETPIEGTSIENAILIPTETKVYGTSYSDKTVWYCFTTNESENSEYVISFVNQYSGYRDIDADIYDENGYKISSKSFPGSGEIVTLYASSFIDEAGVCGTKPKTTYYISLKSAWSSKESDNADPMTFVMFIQDLNNESNDGISLSTNIDESKGISDILLKDIHPGSNAYEAQMIPFDTEISYFATSENYVWFFIETSNNDAKYTITHSVEDGYDENIVLIIEDEFGHNLLGYLTAEPLNGECITTLDSRDSGWHHIDNGKMYYIGISKDRYDSNNDDPAKFKLSINIEEYETNDSILEDLNDADGKENDEILILEKPYELNETQIKFLADSADFVNIDEAIKAVMPIGNILLNHSDAKILIAGTTATTGSQSDCEHLSNKRANAVKNLLIDYYGVKSEQITTIGLGYEKDPFQRGKDRDSNGNFIPSEAAKNRRVVILDINSDIVSKILN